MKKVVNEGTGQGTSSDNTFLLNEEIRYFKKILNLYWNVKGI